MDVNKLWEGFHSSVKASTNESSYSAFFSEKSLSLHKFDEEMSIVYLATDIDFNVKFLTDNYLPQLEDIFQKLVGKKVKVIIKLKKDYEEKKPVKTSTYVAGKEKLFNPKYNFQNFIVGDCNKYAYAASVAVSEMPGETYNPLFIYGGSGLGKTHLMQAIGVQISRNKPDAKVLYVSSEMFTDEFIKATQEGTLKKFNNKYRKLDVLLIDDIQFLAGKERTQEEFFYTFEYLYNNNKQIVITGDCPPSSLKDLDERLRTRFSWNMIADIQVPDYETRVAILRNLAEKSNLEINDAVYKTICLIAEQVTDNIRELEGAFNRILGFSNLMGEEITPDYAKMILKDIISDNEQAIEPERIKRAVASYYKIKVADIESPKRNAEINLPRQVAMYICRKNTEISFPDIGKIFGGRHHSTVMHACNAIEDKLKYDDALAEDIAAIENEIIIKKK